MFFFSITSYETNPNKVAKHINLHYDGYFTNRFLGAEQCNYRISQSFLEVVEYLAWIFFFFPQVYQE